MCRNTAILFIIILLIESCGILSSSAYPSSYRSDIGLRVYEYVDEWPTYNGEIWGYALTKDFNQRFSYIHQTVEVFQTSIKAELIINRKGKLVAVKMISDEDSDYSKAVSQFLYSCQEWTPGVIKGKTVNTKLVWFVVF